MRIYLDTNILYFLILGSGKELGSNVRALLNDYSNIFITSTICMQELIHLCQTGKIPLKKKENRMLVANEILERLERFGIIIEQVNKQHLAEYARLPMIGDHRDPNDRLIIAQAISDKIILISSDLKFELYAKCGLEFVLNER